MVEFKVGHKYENVKGVYKVVSIDGDSMVIRWDSGEQVTSTIELQRRIIERMEWERLEASRPRKKKSKCGGDFDGLGAGDFKDSVTGTSWRSRASLGGAVTTKLPSDKFKFNSWSIYGTPRIQWLDREHQEHHDTWFQAKFFVQLDEGHLSYGFCIERSDDPKDPKDDWKEFIFWLRDKKNEDWLNGVASNQNLDIRESGKNVSLASLLESLPEGRWRSAEIAKRVPKEQVLQRAESIADDISALFETLMPLYEASAPRAAIR